MMPVTPCHHCRYPSGRANCCIDKDLAGWGSPHRVWHEFCQSPPRLDNSQLLTHTRLGVPMHWNRRNLLRACEDLLRRDDCTLKLKTINSGSTATCDFTTTETGVKHITLVVDPSIASLVEGFLHEALHVVLVQLDEQFNDALEEVLVRALERELWVKTMNPEATARWRKLINEKLK